VRKCQCIFSLSGQDFAGGGAKYKDKEYYGEVCSDEVIPYFSAGGRVRYIQAGFEVCGKSG
jgi:hypothetical protein